MAITLDDAEQRRLLDRSHTGILTTLRADGRPVSLPVWFVLIDDAIYVQTPSRSAKIKRARRDPRGTFLVESGERWAELTALHLDVEVSLVDDEGTVDAVTKAINTKYEGHRLRVEGLPERVQRAYADQATLELRPTGDTLSWDNAKIRMG